MHRAEVHAHELGKGFGLPPRDVVAVGRRCGAKLPFEQVEVGQGGAVERRHDAQEARESHQEDDVEVGVAARGRVEPLQAVGDEVKQEFAAFLVAEDVE